MRNRKQSICDDQWERGYNIMYNLNYKLNKYSLNKRYDNLSLCDIQSIDEVTNNVTSLLTAHGYTQGPDTTTATYKWGGGVLTPSGKVVMIPFAYQYIGIYNTGYTIKNPTAPLSAFLNKF